MKPTVPEAQTDTLCKHGRPDDGVDCGLCDDELQDRVAAEMRAAEEWPGFKRHEEAIYDWYLGAQIYRWRNLRHVYLWFMGRCFARQGGFALCIRKRGHTGPHRAEDDYRWGKGRRVHKEKSSTPKPTRQSRASLEEHIRVLEQQNAELRWMRDDLAAKLAADSHSIFLRLPRP